MKLSLLLTTVLSGLILSGCGAAEDAINDAVNDFADDSSASYTAGANNSGGFNITFKVNNSGTSTYSYKIGSSIETNTHTIDGVDYSITDVVGNQYTDTSGIMPEKTNTLSCTPTNEETFTCTDDLLFSTSSVDLEPKRTTNGHDTLFLYKCKTSVDLNLAQSSSAYNATCEKQAASITVNGLQQ